MPRRLVVSLAMALALSACGTPAPPGPVPPAVMVWPGGDPGPAATGGAAGPGAPDMAGALGPPAAWRPGGDPAAPRGGPAASAPPAAAAWRPALKAEGAVASSGPAEHAVDGDRTTEWNPRAFIAPGAPQWLALPLDAPAAGMLAVSWHGHALHYVNYDYGRPRSFTIQASTDSADGRDGSWTDVATVADNLVRSRVTLVRAPGARWLRLTFTSAWSGLEREPFLREVAVHEETRAGAPDVWLVLGDSTTSVGLDPGKPDHLAAAVSAKHPGHHPVVLSGGTGGDRALEAVERLRVALPTLPPGSLVGLCYGSNDAKHALGPEVFRGALQAAVDRLREAGHQPLVATTPWNLNGRIADYARVCREVATANRLPPGPDFFTWFRDHPEELEVDKVHPNEKGIASMQRLWAESGAFRYAGP